MTGTSGCPPLQTRRLPSRRSCRASGYRLPPAPVAACFTAASPAFPSEALPHARSLLPPAIPPGLSRMIASSSMIRMSAVVVMFGSWVAPEPPYSEQGHPAARAAGRQVDCTHAHYPQVTPGWSGKSQTVTNAGQFWLDCLRR